MKIILRIGAILAVALVVVGAAMAVRSLSGSGSDGQPRGISEQGFQQVRFQLGTGRPDGDFGGRDSGGLNGLGGLLRNLLNVGLVVVVGAAALRGWKQLRTSLRGSPPMGRAGSAS